MYIKVIKLTKSTKMFFEFHSDKSFFKTSIDQYQVGVLAPLWEAILYTVYATLGIMIYNIMTTMWLYTRNCKHGNFRVVVFFTIVLWSWKFPSFDINTLRLMSIYISELHLYSESYPHMHFFLKFSCRKITMFTVCIYNVTYCMVKGEYIYIIMWRFDNRGTTG